MSAVVDRFQCLQCASPDAHSKYQRVPDRFHGFPGEFTYVTCAQCGLVQHEHVPPNLGAFYTGYRVHTGDSLLYRVLRRLTIGHCYLGAQGEGKALLDIGCGNGFYLKQMAGKGWQPTGYEFDPEYAATLSQQIELPVIAGEQTLAEHEGRFDLVTFNFSFEHLDRPVQFLELAARALRPGGQIYIAVPNIESREAAVFGSRWFHLDPPRHVSFFTKAHLRAQLERLGFTDVKVKNLAIPTGFAGSISYRLWNRFQGATWYAGIIPGLLFSLFVRDGNFAISARRRA